MNQKGTKKDGDVRPAGALFDLKRRAATAVRPRLAWKPWVRGFIIGALFGAAAVFAYFLWRLSEVPDWQLPSGY